MKTTDPHRLQHLTLPEAAAILSAPTNGDGVWKQEIQDEWTRRLSEWAAAGELEMFPEGTTCLFYVAHCLTHAKGAAAPGVEPLADQMYSFLKTFLYGIVPEAAVRQVDGLMHRIRRAHDTAHARTIVEDFLGNVNMLGADDKRSGALKTRGYIPGDISNTLERPIRNEEVRRAVDRIEKDPRKYEIARSVLLNQHNGNKIFTVWCLENDFHPVTGAEQECHLLADRLPFLRECGLIQAGQANEAAAAKLLYKIYRKQANRQMNAALNQALRSPTERKRIWELDDNAGADGDAVATAFRRRHLRRLMPNIPHDRP